MKYHLPKLPLIGFVGVIAISGFYARSQSDQTTSTTKPNLPTLQERLSKHSGRPPMGKFEEAVVESQEDHRRRQIREGLYRGFYRRRIVDPGTKEVNGQAETIDLTFIDGVTILKPGERPDPPGLPVSSTAIVRATVINGKAFLSEDHTYVYSDYQIQINEVLKQDPDRAIPINSQITAWRSGGSLRFPSAHIKHFIVSNRGFPELGTEYLFFLRRADQRLNAYAISTAYALKDGLVLSLDDAQDYNSLDGMNAIDFLSIVRNAINNAQVGVAQR